MTSMLTGSELLAKVKELGDVSKSDLVRSCGYVSTTIGSGQAQRYSERNWGRRWMVEGGGTGWWIEINQGD